MIYQLNDLSISWLINWINQITSLRIYFNLITCTYWVQFELLSHKIIDAWKTIWFKSKLHGQHLTLGWEYHSLGVRRRTTTYRRNICQGVVPTGHVIEHLWAIISPLISKSKVKRIKWVTINKANINIKSTAVNHAENSVHINLLVSIKRLHCSKIHSKVYSRYIHVTIFLLINISTNVFFFTVEMYNDLHNFIFCIFFVCLIWCKLFKFVASFVSVV